MLYTKYTSLFLLLLCLLASFSLNGAEESEEVVIRLSTENELIPVYLTKFEGGSSGFDASYLEKLQSVLDFDLNHNGMTFVVPTSKEAEDAAKNLTQVTPSTAKAFKALYAIKGSLQKGNKIS